MVPTIETPHGLYICANAATDAMASPITKSIITPPTAQNASSGDVPPDRAMKWANPAAIARNLRALATPNLSGSLRTRPMMFDIPWRTGVIGLVSTIRTLVVRPGEKAALVVWYWYLGRRARRLGWMRRWRGGLWNLDYVAGVDQIRVGAQPPEPRIVRMVVDRPPVAKATSIGDLGESVPSPNGVWCRHAIQLLVKCRWEPRKGLVI